MKILTGRVIDPRPEGETRNPFLSVQVDDYVNETGQPVVAGTGADLWRMVPHGPFVGVDQWDGSDWTEGDLGTLNTTDFWHQRLVECVVEEPDSEMDLAMDLVRARRLLRKYRQPWTYVLDDVAGQHGKLQWRLVANDPRCVNCGAPGPHEVYYDKTYLTLCEADRAKHSRKIRHLRTTINS